MVVCLSASMRPAAAQTFGYFGPIGPGFWSDLNPAAWGACNSGTLQSPVNLGHLPIRPNLEIDYGTTTGEIFNNGHTIEVETEGANSLILDGVVFELTQFHLHTPSEHRVLGFGYDMEMHLAHECGGSQCRHWRVPRAWRLQRNARADLRRASRRPERQRAAAGSVQPGNVSATFFSALSVRRLTDDAALH
jgi:hypothetical protein